MGDAAFCVYRELMGDSFSGSSFSAVITVKRVSS